MFWKVVEIFDFFYLGIIVNVVRDSELTKILW